MNSKRPLLAALALAACLIGPAFAQDESPAKSPPMPPPDFGLLTEKPARVSDAWKFAIVAVPAVITEIPAVVADHVGEVAEKTETCIVLSRPVMPSDASAFSLYFGKNRRDRLCPPPSSLVLFDQHSVG